ncbi:MAG: nuclease A inhibitor family protein [Cyanobacteria bacterium CAN_BIN43]|nr:nuclease A inhibitor family protein [Cyanobacteria bacterium CAN_BIN43]
MSLSETLMKASKNLLMSSESDYPFEFFHWEAQADLTTEKLLELAGYPQDTPVEVVELDYLFRNVAQEKEWQDEAEKINVSSFQTLVKTLKESLRDIKVYRVGTINIDVYIVGKADGNLTGLSTKLVET